MDGGQAMTSRLAAAADASLIARSLRAVASGFQSAYPGSAVAVAATRVVGYWSANSRFERRRWTGITLVTAAVVHASLRVVEGSATGWLWLIIPGIAMAQGLLLVAASASGVDE